MLTVWLAFAAAQGSVALPPPLCRGRVVQGGYNASLDREPSTRAHEEVKAAYAALCPGGGCGQGKLFQNETIGNNAVTWVSGIRHGGQTRVKIVYSAPFLNALNDTYGPGASFGVLAHEVGHHLTAAKGMRQRGESSWNEELRADYMAGCALGRAGRGPKEMENALRALAAVATASHPSFKQRVPVVRRGYEECRGQAGDFARSRDAFGIGRLRQNYDQPSTCWGYWYRLRSDIGRVGPVAAPRRRATGYADRVECVEEKTRRKTERQSEACTCER
ncbi:MAG: hypothetical protein AAFV29_07930 [Myxococcota bacterium]